MEAYQTEEQQVEAIKKFWNENGNSIIAGIAVGLLGFAGFGYYQDHKKAEEEAISDQYLTMIESNATNSEEFIKAGEQFIAQHPKTTYASLTAFALAKTAAEQKQWDSAEKYLTQAVEKAPTEAIKALATIRLARVQIEQNEIEKALATLQTPMPASFKASIEETKGDAYILQGKRDMARDAYQAAIDADGLATSPNLQMKIDDLALSLN